MTSWNATLAAVAGLALVHLLAGHLRFLEGIPRNRWLSFAGGVSVAYVIVRILPELSASENSIEQPANAVAPFLEDHVYLLVLVGLVAFYGVERLSAGSRQRQRQATGVDETEDWASVLSIGAFAVYNAIIGYVIADFDATPEESLPLFAVALGVHFLVNDFGLRAPQGGSPDNRIPIALLRAASCSTPSRRSCQPSGNAGETDAQKHPEQGEAGRRERDVLRGSFPSPPPSARAFDSIIDRYPLAGWRHSAEAEARDEDQRIRGRVSGRNADALPERPLSGRERAQRPG